MKEPDLIHFFCRDIKKKAKKNTQWQPVAESTSILSYCSRIEKPTTTDCIQLMETKRMNLFDAILADDIDTMRKLIHKKASIDERSLQNRTPLQLAVEENLPGPAQLLVEANAQVDEYDSWVTQALMTAVTSKKQTMLHVLIAAKADVNIDYINGTPLMLALRHGRTDAIRVLAKAGARLDPEDEQVRQAVYTAVAKGDVITLPALVEAKASVDVVDTEGRSLLELAQAHGKDNVVGFLARVQGISNPVSSTPAKKKKKPKPQPDEDNAAISIITTPQKKRVPVPILPDEEKQAHPHSPSSVTHTIASSSPKAARKHYANILRMEPSAAALCSATVAGDIDAVLTLIIRKAPVNAPDEKGRMPLQLALENSNLDAIRILISAGADMTILDHMIQRSRV